MPTLQVARLKSMLADSCIIPESRVVPLRQKHTSYRSHLNGLASAHFVTTTEKFDKLWSAWSKRQRHQDGQECWAISSTNTRTGTVHKRGRIVL